jgi:hypothetical protein
MEQSESTKVHPDIGQEREAFERYMSEGGKWPRAVERKPDGTYALMNAQVRWETWQAAKADERDRQAKSD